MRVPENGVGVAAGGGGGVVPDPAIAAFSAAKLTPMSVPSVAEGGAVFVTARSATGLATLVLALLTLFAGFGSMVPEVSSLAVLVITVPAAVAPLLNSTLTPEIGSFVPSFTTMPSTDAGGTCWAGKILRASGRPKWAFAWR